MTEIYVDMFDDEVIGFRKYQPTFLADGTRQDYQIVVPLVSLKSAIELLESQKAKSVGILEPITRI